jgi:hypothetical protein
MRHPVIVGMAVLGLAAALVAGVDPWKALVAVLAFYLMMRLGILMLGGMARPIPEPPPAGELRKVKLAFRCEHCGAEVRMTVSPTQEPEAPRHCQDDMVLVTPVDDI